MEGDPEEGWFLRCSVPNGALLFVALIIGTVVFALGHNVGRTNERNHQEVIDHRELHEKLLQRLETR